MAKVSEMWSKPCVGSTGELFAESATHPRLISTRLCPTRTPRCEGLLCTDYPGKDFSCVNRIRKDLIRVAGEGLRAHILSSALLVLPYSDLLKYLWSFLAVHVLKMETKAFQHVCLHSRGKAVLSEIARSFRLSDYVIEHARMTLHRFGNTSSSSAYFEAKERIKKGDRVRMISLGMGFKCSSIVWKALKDLSPSPTTNPWLDCIHRYTVKS